MFADHAGLRVPETETGGQPVPPAADLVTIRRAVAGTLLVHLAFYKLLRVPLPWGVLRPLY